MQIKESETTELKRSTSELKEAIISMAAMLNKHRRGEVYFGIKNDGEVAGQTVTDSTLREISQEIADNIEPRIFPKINNVSIGGKSCAHVGFTGKDVPYYAYGRAYMRVGDQDRKISAKELEHMIIEKNKDKLAWDKEICEKAGLKDISRKRLKWFLKEAQLNFESVENSLEKLGLMKDSKMTNAAVILFG
ncbi:MAG: ATP-binding protein, partial [Nanoarchaeota archaeon]|nr:ATP-binding protein [Nanoarchaeota archaeon]